MTWFFPFRLWSTEHRRSLARMPQKRRSIRPQLEQLENRLVPSASFGSAIRIGPDQANPSGGWGRDIATDSAGNVYITGLFDGAVDFDPAHPNTDGVLQSKNNASNSFVAKYAADGTFQWAQRMGGDGTSGLSDIGKALAVDSSGNVYVVGSFSNNADFGSTTLTTANGDGFVTKLNSAGAFQWVTPFTDGDGGGMGDVAVDGNGNVYITRTTNPSGVLTNANLFAVVDKLADNGTSANVVWEGRFGNTASGNINTGTGIKVDPATGKVFVTGTFYGSVDFNPGSGTYTLTSPKVKGQYAQEGFVLELTTGNSFGWAKEIAAMPNDLAVDGSDNVYATGASGNSVQSGSGGPLNTTKISSSGALLWSENFANGAQNAAGAGSYGVTVDSSGNVYTAGYFTGTANFNPNGTFNLTSAGDRDIFVSELNASGGLVWAGAMGGSGSDQGQSIAVDGSGNIYTTGLYSGTADFDPGTGVYDLTCISTGREIFVSKLVQSAPLLATASVTPSGAMTGTGAAQLSPAAAASSSSNSTVFDPSLLNFWLPLGVQNTSPSIPPTGQTNSSESVLSVSVAQHDAVMQLEHPRTAPQDRLALTDQLFSEQSLFND